MSEPARQLRARAAPAAVAARLGQAYELLPDAALERIASFVAANKRSGIRGACRALREAANASVQHAKVIGADAEHLPHLARAFPRLRHLDCYCLRDAHVHHLSRFTMLRELNVGFIHLLGQSEGRTATEAIAGLTNLERLELHNMAELGCLGPLARLRELQLDMCKISDAALLEVAKHTALQRLSLNECIHLSSTCLVALTALSALQELSLGAFRYQPHLALEALGSLRSLRSLSFVRTSYDAEQLQHLSLLSALQHVSFKDEHSSHTLEKLEALLLARPSLQALRFPFFYEVAHLSTLAGFVGLTRLELCASRFVNMPAATGEELRRLAPLTDLRHLSIRRYPNLVHWDFVTFLTGLTSLSVVGRTYEPRTRSDDKLIPAVPVSARAAGLLSSLRRLECLELEQPLLDVTPLSRLAALTRLHVAGVRDKGLAALGRMHRLRHLELSEPAFRQVDVHRCLSALVCLTRLDMRGAGVPLRQVRQLVPCLPQLQGCTVDGETIF